MTRAGSKALSSRPLIMGILNLTPDSFSDGGRYTQIDAALAQARQMRAEGADILDLGGESTRPGAQPVNEAEELARVMPVVEALRAEMPKMRLSVDTSKAGVMRAAVQAGVWMINDVYALRGEGALAAVADSDVQLCLMHMQGEPRTMQAQPHYHNVIEDVKTFLAERLVACKQAGIEPQRVYLDPGFGFGKTVPHNLRLMRELQALDSLGCPLLIGVSRKSMIGAVLNKPVEQRLYGGLALAVWAATQGAGIIRTHDVAPTRDALEMLQAVGLGEDYKLTLRKQPQPI